MKDEAGIPVVSKQYSSTNDEERTLWLYFGASEGGYGAYLHNSTNNNMPIDYIEIEAHTDTRVELHIVEGVAIGSIKPIAIDPDEPGYVHPVTAFSGSVTGIKSVAYLDVMYVSRGWVERMYVGGSLALGPGQAIAVKSDGFKSGMIQAAV